MKIADYEVPEDLYYDDYHFWCRPEGDEVVIGMDDFAQRLAGDIVFVQLPFVGKAVTRGKKLSKVESGKWLGTAAGDFPRWKARGVDWFAGTSDWGAMAAGIRAFKDDCDKVR